MSASKPLLAFAGLLLAAGCGGGGSAPIAPAAETTQPFDVGLDALARQQTVNGLVPSLQIGVERRGRVVFDRAYGSQSLMPPVAADVTTMYQIASLTKAFTATAILLLSQDGKLSLDDALARYVPEYPPANAISLRQMLAMTSGIPSDVNDGFTTLYGAIDHESVVRRLATYPLDFSPGTKFEYANLNYYLLGLVVERVSGADYASFVAARILAPLGLRRTAYMGAWNGPDTASGYWHDGNARAGFSAHPSWSPDYLFSMGGLVSDAPDLLRWEESLRAPGLLSAASLATIFAVPNRAISSYAMGWFVDPDGSYYHVGESGGFNCATAMYADGYDIVVLGNTWDQYPGAFDPLAVVQAVHRMLPR